MAHVIRSTQSIHLACSESREGPQYGGSEISEPPSTTCANIGHSRSTNELARSRNFRSKTQFMANFSPPLENLGARWTAITNRRKLLIRVGKAAVKISDARMTAFELLAECIHKKNEKFQIFANHP